MEYLDSRADGHSQDVAGLDEGDGSGAVSDIRGWKRWKYWNCLF